MSTERAGSCVEVLNRHRAGKGEDHAAATLQFVCLADVDPQPIDWIWPGRIARRKLMLLGGDPEVGKSQVGIDIAARLSLGAAWPDEGRAPSGTTIALATEDAIADTIRPRAEAAGADLAHIHALKAATDVKGKRRTFNLQLDLDSLARKVHELGDVAMIMIDPITSYLGKIDGNQTSDVRGVLEPVADFAETHKVAVLGITHPTKHAPAKAMNAFTGSLAFIAIARLGFICVEEPDSDGRKLLIPVKNNIGARAPGLGYRLVQRIVSNNIVAPHIVWDHAPVNISADEALAAAADNTKNASAMTEAKEFLGEELAGGPVPAADIMKRGQALGMSERTLNRAKKKLGIVARKEPGTMHGGWIWEMPR